MSQISNSGVSSSNSPKLATEIDLAKEAFPACIFYDLETTDKDPIGQIVNLSFIVTDANFKILGEFNRDVKISRLQLPRAGAIAANHTDVIKHQASNPPSEREVMHDLWEFLNDVFVHSKRISMVGFNNLGFDQNYLRTSFIRNGLSPYYQKSVTENDLFLLTQSLAISHSDFPKVKGTKERKNGGAADRRSLSLETITKALGLLDGPQTHHSRDDVLLTIELAKVYKEKFGASIIGFNAYQGGGVHSGIDKSENRGQIIMKREPQYDLGSEALFVEKPFMFLDANHRYSLWVDLEAFKKGEKSLRFVKADVGPFFTDGKVVKNEELQLIADEAGRKFEKVNLSNYFTETECDIEQHIYRIDFANIESLNSLIWHQGGGGQEMSLDAKRVFTRYRLANYKINGKSDEKFLSTFKEYALHRYGGKLRLDKGLDCEDRLQKKDPRQYFHPNWNTLLREIDEKMATGSEEMRSLMGSLKQFYMESEVCRVAGEELNAIPPIEPKKGDAN
jgi:DNA polymerase III epsilon subunit-like protein